MLHDALLSALSRMVHEEGKKHLELAINIVHVFAIISDYDELHSIIVEYRMGSTAIALLEFTLKQYKLYGSDLPQTYDEQDLKIA